MVKISTEMRILHVLLASTVESLGEQTVCERKMKFENMELEVLLEYTKQCGVAKGDFPYKI